MLNSSWNLLNTILKVKNRRFVWVQSDCKCSGCLPSWSRGWLGAMAHCCCHPGSWESFVLHVASLGKDQNLKFEACFLLNVCCYHTMVKLKPPKSETICIEALTSGMGIFEWTQVRLSNLILKLSWVSFSNGNSLPSCVWGVKLSLTWRPYNFIWRVALLGDAYYLEVLPYTYLLLTL